MVHALRYEGGFEQNFDKLKPGATTYISSSGSEHKLPPWPGGIDGLRIGYMEKAGKKFAAVRVQHGKLDIILKNPILIDPVRHMGNKRFAPEPTLIADAPAAALLRDVIESNAPQRDELLKVRDQLRDRDRQSSRKA